MREIFINGRFLTQGLTGVQRYAMEIVRGIDRLIEEEPARYGGVAWTLLTPQDASVLSTQRIKLRQAGSFTGHAWDQMSFAGAARTGVALSLASTGPVIHKRALVAIHDAAVFQAPEGFGATYRHAHRLIGHLLARRSGIVTVSEFSRQELSKALGIEQDQILVAPNGHEHLKITPDHAAVRRLSLEGRPYFVVLGSTTRNKNLGLAVAAMNMLDAGSANLVVIGDHSARVFGPVQLSECPGLIRAGRLPDTEISGLLRSARALIFPSLYEGFGIPPVEAMVNHCPVLASTAPAVRETCGAAAEYFDPHDAVALAHLMRQLLDDAEGQRRARMIDAGVTQAAKFKWAPSARLIADRCLSLAHAE